MPVFSKILMMVVSLQAITSCACDPRDVVTWLGGTVSLASALVSMKLHRNHTARCAEQERSLQQKAQLYSQQSKRLVEAGCGTFLELSTYDYNGDAAKKGEYGRLAQEGKRLMEEVKPEKLQEPKSLACRMELLTDIEGFVETYGRTVQRSYQTAYSYDVLDRISALKDEYEPFVRRQQEHHKQLAGCALLWIAATGCTAFSFHGSL